jgi:hypothetical protein
MQHTDHRVQRGELRNVAGLDRQNAADQDLLDVLRALRRAIDDQDRRRGRHDIHDATWPRAVAFAAEWATPRSITGVAREHLTWGPWNSC